MDFISFFVCVCCLFFCKQTHLEHTTLEKVCTVAQVIYDPDPTKTIVPQDKQWVGDYYEFPDEEELPQSLGRWLLRVQLDSKVMIDKKLTMKEIGETIYREFENDELDCIWTDDNSDELVLRIRIKKHGAEQDSVDDQASEIENRFLQKLMLHCLVGITLRGVNRITKVYMREEARTLYNETTVRKTKHKQIYIYICVYVYILRMHFKQIAEQQLLSSSQSKQHELFPL